jgi:hypothetical protein
MAQLTWKGNSKKMFDRLIAASPGLCRKTAEESLLSAIRHTAVNGTVTEDSLIEAIHLAAPDPLKEKVLQHIVPLKTQ